MAETAQILLNPIGVVVCQLQQVSAWTLMWYAALQEWEPPQPSRRPDIFPEFEKMERVFLPKPLPGDPEMPDEESEEAAKRTEPGDPDPEAPPGEPSEPEPGEEGTDPEKQPNIPSIPE